MNIHKYIISHKFIKYFLVWKRKLISRVNVLIKENYPSYKTWKQEIFSNQQLDGAVKANSSEFVFVKGRIRHLVSSICVTQRNSKSLKFEFQFSRFFMMNVKSFIHFQTKFKNSNQSLQIQLKIHMTLINYLLLF